MSVCDIKYDVSLLNIQYCMYVKYVPLVKHPYKMMGDCFFPRDVNKCVIDSSNVETICKV